MPIIKSAQKRVRTARKATVRNSKTKRSLKTAVKAFHTAIKSGDKKAGEKLKEAQRAIDTATKKNVLHRNKAARKKSQLSKAAKAAGVAVAAGVAAGAAAKAASKKATAPAKKPVAKKAPAAKKAAPKK